MESSYQNESEFVFRSAAFESSLDATYKKQNGIYYTDINLARSIIDNLSLSDNSKVIDPCVGIGNFLFAAKQLGLKNVYGVDIDHSAVQKCKSLVGFNNVICMDSIGNSAEEVMARFGISRKFDAVVGNPPYVPIGRDFFGDNKDLSFRKAIKGAGNNLFVAALYRAFELVKDDGVISYIIPKNFLHVSSYSALRKMMLKEKTIESIINLGIYFKDVRGEQVIITIRNTKPVQSHTIQLGTYEKGNIEYNTKINQTDYSDEMILFDNDTDKELYLKLESSFLKFSDFNAGYIGRGRSKAENAISGKDIRKFGLKGKEQPKDGNQLFIQNIYSAEAGIIAAFGGNMEASETVTVFTDGDAAMCNYMLGILHSRLINFYLIKYCFNNSRVTMHTDAKYLKKLPLVKNSDYYHKVVNYVQSLELLDYLSEEWFDTLESLNNIVYEIYGITENEKKYIESEIKKIQSEKWFYEKQQTLQ
ncbi:MAG: N-6 DNA methylase [Candidatus Cloacimonetes bacterium]|nr:N-6 DNA methylase [Candidatus Cloacimonadota bacterium]